MGEIDGKLQSSIYQFSNRFFENVDLPHDRCWRKSHHRNEDQPEPSPKFSATTESSRKCTSESLQNSCRSTSVAEDGGG